MGQSASCRTAMMGPSADRQLRQLLEDCGVRPPSVITNTETSSSAGFVIISSRHDLFASVNTSSDGSSSLPALSLITTAL